MLCVEDYCLEILLSGSLDSKLIDIPEEIKFEDRNFFNIELPVRDPKISFSDKKSKIPRLEHLNLKINRAICLHHFANHELMAIELFAWAILKFRNLPIKIKKDLLLSLKEEQKHFKLYLNRMRELGIDFGDKPLNQIFWKFLPYMNTFEKFTSILSLSIEGANLDYATVYQKTFSKFEDHDSASIMKIVFQDELKHVKRGLNSIELILEREFTWKDYLNFLEYPFTPRRAKGYFFIPDTRRKVGFSEEFIKNLAEYRDEFSNRKKEIIPEELLSWGIYTG
jgi:uncharacterized ferritin-like protein (DUF455 family)